MMIIYSQIFKFDYSYLRYIFFFILIVKMPMNVQFKINYKDKSKK